MFQSGCLEFSHVAVHPANDFIIVIFVDLGIFHVPSGKLLGQDLIEYIVFIESNGLMDTSVAVSFGRNINTVPFFHKYIHAVGSAEGKKLAFQIVIGRETVFTPGGVEYPVADIGKVKQKSEFLFGQLDVHDVPPENGLELIIAGYSEISRCILKPIFDLR